MMENTMITEEMLGAYIEGSLSPEDMMFVEQELSMNPELQSLVDDVYGLNVVPIQPEALGIEIDSIDLPQIMVIAEEPVMELNIIPDSEEIPEEIIEEVDPNEDFIDDVPFDEGCDWSQWNPGHNNPTDEDLLLM